MDEASYCRHVSVGYERIGDGGWMYAWLLPRDAVSISFLFFSFLDGRGALAKQQCICSRRLRVALQLRICPLSEVQIDCYEASRVVVRQVGCGLYRHEAGQWQSTADKDSRPTCKCVPETMVRSIEAVEKGSLEVELFRQFGLVSCPSGLRGRTTRRRTTRRRT